MCDIVGESGISELSLEAIDMKYLLNSFAIARLSEIRLLFTMNDGFKVFLVLPRRSFINFQVLFLSSLHLENC